MSACSSFLHIYVIIKTRLLLFDDKTHHWNKKLHQVLQIQHNALSLVGHTVRFKTCLQQRLERWLSESQSQKQPQYFNKSGGCENLVSRRNCMQSTSEKRGEENRKHPLCRVLVNVPAAQPQ